MSDFAVDSLRRLVGGPVLTTSDAGFAEEVAAWELQVLQRPDVAVGAATADDVAEAVRFAARNNLRVSVQSTGHGADAPVRSGVMITTRRLADLAIDPGTGIATIGAGVRWQRVIDDAAPHGLMPVAGSSTAVGVVGYLLGGGLGPLSRSHGFSSDYLSGLTVVTASGDIVQADADTNSDLFWALRGGKAGFGIVTEVRLALVAQRTLYAGSLVFDTGDIEAALRGWVDYTATAPNDVTTSIAVMRLPDMAMVPEPLRGRTVLSLRFAYPGDAAEGERLAAPLRALAPVYLDNLGEMPVTDVALIHGDPEDPMPSWLRGGLLASADQDLATAVLAHVGAAQHPPIVSFEIRHLGAATHIDVPGGSAVGGRPAGFTVMAISVPDPSLFDTVVRPAIDGLYTDLGPWMFPGNTINFATRITTADQFAECWPPDIFERLAAIRTANDPAGIFSPAVFA
jgi:FAD/FMN-containing dehydrogenase